MRFCRPQLILLFVAAILGISSMLSACGKRGPLYLPDPGGQQQKSSPSSPTE